MANFIFSEINFRPISFFVSFNVDQFQNLQHYYGAVLCPDEGMFNSPIWLYSFLSVLQEQQHQKQNPRQLQPPPQPPITTTYNINYVLLQQQKQKQQLQQQQLQLLRTSTSPFAKIARTTT